MSEAFSFEHINPVSRNAGLKQAPDIDGPKPGIIIAFRETDFYRAVMPLIWKILYQGHHYEDTFLMAFGADAGPEEINNRLRKTLGNLGAVVVFCDNTVANAWHLKQGRVPGSTLFVGETLDVIVSKAVEEIENKLNGQGFAVAKRKIGPNRGPTKHSADPTQDIVSDGLCIQELLHLALKRFRPQRIDVFPQRLMESWPFYQYYTPVLLEYQRKHPEDKQLTEDMLDLTKENCIFSKGVLPEQLRERLAKFLGKPLKQPHEWIVEWITGAGYEPQRVKVVTDLTAIDLKHYTPERKVWIIGGRHALKKEAIDKTLAGLLPEPEKAATLCAALKRHPILKLPIDTFFLDLKQHHLLGPDQWLDPDELARTILRNMWPTIREVETFLAEERTAANKAGETHLPAVAPPSPE